MRLIVGAQAAIVKYSNDCLTHARLVSKMTATRSAIEERSMLLKATRFVSADPDAVFALITSPARLSEWNRAIVRTVEAPERLEPDSAWVVELHALGQSWPSRSTVKTLDQSTRRFSYRSQTDDGNPSHADWIWHVAEAPGGSDLSVTVDLHPVTFWRRMLLARIRARQLRREMDDSLEQLATTLASVAN
jgi:uncharacterized protein YndB with AHSA1/START domain